MLTPAWTTASLAAARLPALDEAIDLWLVNLDASVLQFNELLDEDERARANRYVFPVHARRFAAARGCLRALLGSYLECAPLDVEFDYETWGKPSVRAPADSRLAFNLAHSGEHALIAIGRTASLGIDIETIRPLTDWRDVAANTFAPMETHALMCLPSEVQLDGFFACWTRKEAVVKYWGQGLSADLTSFEVSVEPTDASSVLAVERRDSESILKLISFKVDPNAWAALAAPASEPNLRFWRLS